MASPGPRSPATRGGWTTPSPRPAAGTPPSTGTATAPDGSRARPVVSAGSVARAVAPRPAALDRRRQLLRIHGREVGFRAIDVHRRHLRPARPPPPAAPRRSRGPSSSRPRLPAARRDALAAGRRGRRRPPCAAAARARGRGPRPTVCQAGDSTWLAAWRTSWCRKGRNTGWRARSFQEVSMLLVHTSTRPLPTVLRGQRDRAVVEAGQHAVLRAPAAGSGRSARTRSRRCAGRGTARRRDGRSRRRPASRPSPRTDRRRARRARAGGPPASPDQAPGALWSPSTTRRPPPALHELAQPPRGGRARGSGVVEDDQHARREVLRPELGDVLHLHAEARPMADGQRALQVQAAARAERPFSRTRTGRSPPGASTKWNASSSGQGVGSDAHGAAGHGGREREGLEGDGGRGVGPEARALLAHDAAVHLEGRRPRRSTGRAPLFTSRAVGMTRSRPDS